MTSASGAIAATFAYDGFCNLTGSTGAGANPLRFAALTVAGIEGQLARTRVVSLHRRTGRETREMLKVSVQKINSRVSFKESSVAYLFLSVYSAPFPTVECIVPASTDSV